MAGRSRSGGRVVQAGFLLLLAVCALQVGWWILDEVRYTARVRDNRLAAYARELAAARALVDRGVPPREIEALMPGVRVDAPSRTVTADPGVAAALDAARARRLNRFFWEGVFFLAVLVAGMAILVRTLRRDAELRRRQENFLAAVSHEFRSPLASMRLGVETLALRDPPAPARQRVVTRLTEEIDRLDRLIGNMLETRRLEEGRVALSPERVDVADAVRQVIEARAARADAARVEVRSDVAPGAVVRADRAAFESVVGNLLDNAITACESADAGHVRIEVFTEPGVVRLAIADDGRGFPPGEAARLFGKFYRTGNELRRTTQGSGLGLYIVKRLVEEHGGDVSGSSEGIGRGARFVVRWPRAEAA